MQETEIRKCDFCEKEASDNCWGSTCEICGTDLCDEHLIRPLPGKSFTVCPECNKTDLSDIFKIIFEVDNLYNQYKIKSMELKEALRKRGNKE
jgi:hypothetical protein